MCQHGPLHRLIQICMYLIDTCILYIYTLCIYVPSHIHALCIHVSCIHMHMFTHTYLFTQVPIHMSSTVCRNCLFPGVGGGFLHPCLWDIFCLHVFTVRRMVWRSWTQGKANLHGFLSLKQVSDPAWMTAAKGVGVATKLWLDLNDKIMVGHQRAI